MKTQTAAAPRFLEDAQALACVHCGLCLAACPTYLETGNENESPRGRIYLMRALHEGRLPLAAGVVRHIDLCLGCRACEAACPSGVPYGALLEATREHIEKHHRRSLGQTWLRRVAIERVFPYPRRFKLALRAARLARALGAGQWLPKAARDALALLPAHVARARELPELSPATSVPRRGRVGFMRGCVAGVLCAETNAATVALLNRAGFDVLTPRSQACCGALHAHAGRLTRARACARRNLVAFDAESLDAIVVNAAGCGSTLKEYGHLLAGDSGQAARAQRFAAKVQDLSEWLLAQPGFVDALRNAQRADSGRGARVTFHDACHLAHAQGVTRAPRELLRAVVGESFVELPESDLCCGSAGSYNLTEPVMAARLQRRKVENILRTGADVVVTTNPGCLLQIEAGLRAAGAEHVRVRHLADVLVGWPFC